MSPMSKRHVTINFFILVPPDFKRYEAKKGNQPIYLTALEFALLHFLIEHKDQVASRNLILDQVWGQDTQVYPRTVDLHIAHLRKKIEDDPANPQCIISVRGAGYRFNG